MVNLSELQTDKSIQAVLTFNDGSTRRCTCWLRRGKTSKRKTIQVYEFIKPIYIKDGKLDKNGNDFKSLKVGLFLMDNWEIASWIDDGETERALSERHINKFREYK